MNAQLLPEVSRHSPLPHPRDHGSGGRLRPVREWSEAKQHGGYDAQFVADAEPRYDGERSSLMGSVVPCLLAGVLTLSCALDPEVGKRHLESGDIYFAAQKYKEAIVEYRNAIQHDPRFGEARYRLAEAYVRDNDPARAYREYIRAADLMPANAEAQVKAGQVLLLAGQFEDAKARADRVLANDSRHVTAQILRGNALAGLNDLDQAITQIDEAVKLAPDRIGTYHNLGALQLAKGDRAAAEAAFTRAIEIDGRSVTARLALAIFYLSAGRVPEAEAALERVLEVDAANATANRGLALLYLGSNRAREAEPHLKAVVAVAKTVTTQLALADYYLLMNRPSDAVQILTAVRVDDDARTFAATQSRLAAIAYAQGRTREAHQRLDDILARQSKDSTALLLKARFLLTERRRDDALTQAKAATAADPTSVRAHFLLGELYAATSRFDEAETAFTEVLKLNPHATAAHLELSRVQFASGSVSRAIDSARQALKGQPDNPNARLQLARGLIASHQLVQAQHELKALLTRYPSVSAVHSQMGTLYLRKGEPAAAKRSFERALQLDGRSFEALSGLVGLDLRANRVADARRRIEAKLTHAPRDPRLLLLAARTHAASADLDRAEQLLRRVVDTDPDNPDAHAMLGQIFLSQQKFAEAKAEFDGLAQRRPATADAIRFRTMAAVAVEVQGRPADAQRRYEQILAISPKAIVATNNLAWLYAERGGSLDVALGLAQTAFQLDPDRPEISDTLGWIYYKKGLWAQATAALERSVEADPSNPVYHYHLGLAHTKSGNRLRARQSLERALELDSKFDGWSDAQRVLASLRD